MFIDTTSFALNSIVSAPGSNSNSDHLARAYPESLPASLPLSSLFPPLPYQPSTQPPSDTQSLSEFRSTSSSFPSTMPPAAGGLTFPTSTGIIGPQSQSIPSYGSPSTSDHPPTSTGTTLRAGRGFTLSSALSSNSIVSASLSFSTISGISTALSSTSLGSTPSGTLVETPSVLSLPPTSLLSMTSRSTAVFTFTFTLPPMPILSDSTTQLFSSPTPGSSISFQISHSTSSPLSSTSLALPPTSHTSSVIETTTVFIPSTVYKTITPSSAPVQLPSTSTYTITSVVLGNGGTVTDLVTSSGVLSTETPIIVGSNAPPSPGTVVGIVLGIVGTLAFAALLLFCARRRHRKLVQEAALTTHQNHGPLPLVDEIPDVEEFGYGSDRIYGTGSATTRSGPFMEERYAGILAALHSTEGFGRGHAEGSTGGVYGSQRDGATDADEDIARASSPTLPIHSISPEDLPYTLALSPPPPVPSPSRHQAAQPVPPPSAYYTSRRRSSPGPDAAAWFSGHSVATSCNSQTLGSGSGYGSVDALTRTRTGSEEPLLGMGKPSVEPYQTAPSVSGISPTTSSDHGFNRPGLGSAFGSPEGSLCGPNAISPALYRDMSGSYDARSTCCSGSHGHTRSTTPSSFDVLRSVSSQGALSSSYSHGHGPNQGLKFGFSRPGTSSSGSIEKKRGSGRHSFGVPPTSFKAWKDWGSAASVKEKQAGKHSFGERDWRRSMSGSSSGSMDDKQEKSSPVMGVRALLDRLRRAGHTPSPRLSDRDLPSPTLRESTDVDPEKAIGKMSVERVTPPPPPIHIQPVTPKYQRQYSFILSNPDPHPPSPYSGAGDMPPLTDAPTRQETLPNPHDGFTLHPHDPGAVSPNPGELHPGTTLPVGHVPVTSAPSPAPTEESRLVEGLLHPRLGAQGCSDASLRDFEDYSRPIGGVVKNRLYSTTTFGTLDDTETASPSGGTPVQDLQGIEIGDEGEHRDEPIDVFGAATTRTPRESWFVDDLRHGSARNSPVAL